MTSEHKDEEGNIYFKNFESKHAPPITWQEMMKSKVIIGPTTLGKIVSEAKRFLVTEPGPNLERRRELVPSWLSYWQDILYKAKRYGYYKDDEIINSGDRLMDLNDLSSYLGKWPRQDNGILFVAGGEGHAGHLHAAKYMVDTVHTTTWAFEQESYFAKKKRSGSFLPLEARLSMWVYHPNVHTVSVLPEKEQGMDENEHYDRQFAVSGCDYFFVTEDDPNVKLKAERGKQDKNNIIPRLEVPETRFRAQKLHDIADPFWKSEELFRLPPSMDELHADIGFDGTVFER